MIEYTFDNRIENLFYKDENNKEIEEEWFEVPNYELNYSISNLHRIKRLSKVTQNRSGSYILKDKINNPYISKSGYLTVRLYKNKKSKCFLFHRLIAILFIPNPEKKPYVNHINGIKTDNRVENLEWCTSKENTDHAWITGLAISAKGEKHGRCKLKAYQVIEIRKLKGSATQKKIGELFGISHQVIGDILRGKTWKHLL